VPDLILLLRKVVFTRFNQSPTLQNSGRRLMPSICSLVPELQSADVKNSQVLSKHGAPAPFLSATLLRPTTPDLAGRCIRYDYPPVLIGNTFGGKASIDIAIYARADGTVSSVEVANALSDDVRSELERAAHKCFLSVLKDGYRRRPSVMSN